MRLTSHLKFKKLVVIGDRVLIRPSRPNEKTESGLYLPPGVQEKEKVQQGDVIKTGPGYAIPMHRPAKRHSYARTRRRDVSVFLPDSRIFVRL